MLAVHRTVEAFVDEKIGRRTLLAQLRALALFKFFQLIDGETGIEQNLDGQAKPGVEVVTQAGGAEHGIRRAEGGACAQSSAETIDILGDLNSLSRLRALSQHLRGR